MSANEVIDYTENDVVIASKQYRSYDIILDCIDGTEFIPSLKSNQSIYLIIVGDKTSRAVLGGSPSYLFTPTMILLYDL